MKFFLTLILLLLIFSANLIAQSAPIFLWTDGAPGAIGNEPQDIPTITPYLPQNKTTNAVILVCPGGGYSSLSIPQEGVPVVEWLNSLGISAFLLKYRISPRYRQPASFQDVTRAVRTIRSRAGEWNLDPNKIGIIGFSAGGHLASTVGTHFDNGNLQAKDPIEKVSSRPDLMALIYPVITMFEFTHAGSNKALLGENPTEDVKKFYSSELNVTKETPPTFVVHALGDKTVPVENSLLFISALRKAGVEFELHIYEKGRHGFGIAANDPIIASWKDRYLDWLTLNDFLTKTVVKN